MKEIKMSEVSEKIAKLLDRAVFGKASTKGLS